MKSYEQEQFENLVLNSDKPYNVHFYDFYGNKTKYLSINSEQLNSIIEIITKK